jgi:hypothetical protein
MYMQVRLLILAVALVSLLLGCSTSDSTVTPDEVIVKTGQMDVYFKRGSSFEGTYMVFGGGEMNHPNAYAKIIVCGLDIRIARNIAASYPDFYMCKSAGAPMAQRSTQDFEIVPANSKVHKKLKKTLALHKKNINEGGDQVCVRLEGEVLRLKSVIVRELNQDITHELPPQVHRDYYYVTSAEIIGGKDALEGKM